MLTEPEPQVGRRRAYRPIRRVKRFSSVVRPEPDHVAQICDELTDCLGAWGEMPEIVARARRVASGAAVPRRPHPRDALRPGAPPRSCRPQRDAVRDGAAPARDRCADLGGRGLSIPPQRRAPTLWRQHPGRGEQHAGGRDRVRHRGEPGDRARRRVGTRPSRLRHRRHDARPRSGGCAPGRGRGVRRAAARRAPRRHPARHDRVPRRPEGPREQRRGREAAPGVRGHAGRAVARDVRHERVRSDRGHPLRDPAPAGERRRRAVQRDVVVDPRARPVLRARTARARRR